MKAVFTVKTRNRKGTTSVIYDTYLVTARDAAEAIAKIRHGYDLHTDEVITDVEFVGAIHP